MSTPQYSVGRLFEISVLINEVVLRVARCYTSGSKSIVLEIAAKNLEFKPFINNKNKKGKAMNRITLLAILLSLMLHGCGGGGSSSNNGGNTTSIPDLSITSFTAPSTATAGNSIELDVTITNTGTAKAGDTAGNVPVGFYLSQDNTIDPLSDHFIGWAEPTLNQGLAAGQSAHILKQIFLPTSVSSGTYFIGAYVDPRHVALDYFIKNFPTLPRLNIDESNETNNSALATNQISITGSATCVDDAYENDDVNGHTIAINTLENHNFCYDSLDRINFDASMGSNYTVTVNGLKNTHISLRDASGTLVDTAFESSLTSIITWAVTANQTYSIEISGESIRKGNLTKDEMGNGSTYTVIMQ